MYAYLPIIILPILVSGIVFGFFCKFIAKEKNRDTTSWFWLGFFFQLIALIAIAAIPRLSSSRQYKYSNADIVRAKNMILNEWGKANNEFKERRDENIEPLGSDQSEKADASSSD